MPTVFVFTVGIFFIKSFYNNKSKDPKIELLNNEFFIDPKLILIFAAYWKINSLNLG